MNRKRIGVTALAVLMLAGVGQALAAGETQTALNLSLLGEGAQAAPAESGSPAAGSPPATRAARDQAAIDRCFDYATDSGLGRSGDIAGFDLRTGTGAEELTFQRHLRAAAPDAMRHKLFARCLTSN